ncbi:reprolysin-like metallopeptidase [Chromobacterium vaccinii]|uniref:reprolysin-like metallopeptidase n=1 Tax=Chromobacterium vaccinii TaxID=1108595 RepID=UPI003C77B0BC
MIFGDLFPACSSQAPANLDQQRQGRVLDFDAQVLLQALGQARSGGEAGGIGLMLFPGVGGVCLSHRTESPRPGLHLWHGLAAGGRDLSACLAFSVREEQGAMLAGKVVVDGRHYLIHPAGDAQVRVTLSPPTEPLHCDTVAQRPVRSGEAGVPDADSGRRVRFVAAEEPALISICAFYPAAAAKAQLKIGQAEIELAMLLVQDDTNTVFANSRMPARVHIEARPFAGEPKNIDTQGLLGEALDDKGSLHAELLAHLAEGKTDIVVLLAVHGTLSPSGLGVVVGKAGDIPAPPNAAGVAFHQRVLALALQVTRPSGKPWNMLSPDHALAHELGHLLGARHSEHEEMESGDVSDQLYGYARGYIPPDKSFFTVMAYSSDADDGARALPMYSDHEQTWQGQPTGIAPGLPNAASAAPFLRWSAQELSRYKTGGLKSSSDQVATLKVAVWGIVDQDGAMVELKGVDEAEAAVVIPRGLSHLPRHGTVTVIVAPREGVRLDHWKVDGVAVAGAQRHTAEWPIALTMDESHTLDIYFDIRADIVAAPQCLPAGAINLLPKPGPSLPGRYLVAAGHSKSMAAFSLRQLAATEVTEWREDGVAKAWGGGIHQFELTSTGPRELEARLRRRECKLKIERIPVDSKCLSYFDEEPGNERLHGAARGQRISLEFPNLFKLFDHWEINGQRVAGRQDEHKMSCYLDFSMDGDTVVRVCLNGWQDAVPVTFELVPPLPGLVSLRFIGEQNPDFSVRLTDPGDAYHFNKGARVRLSPASAKRYGITHWAVGDGARTAIADALTMAGSQRVRFFRDV